MTFYLPHLPLVERTTIVGPVDYPWLLGHDEYKAMPRDTQTLYLALLGEQEQGRVPSRAYIELLAQFPKAADYLLAEEWIDFADPLPSSDDFSVDIFLPGKTAEQKARDACLVG